MFHTLPSRKVIAGTPKEYIVLCAVDYIIFSTDSLHIESSLYGIVQLGLRFFLFSDGF